MSCPLVKDANCSSSFSRRTHWTPLSDRAPPSEIVTTVSQKKFSIDRNSPVTSTTLPIYGGGRSRLPDRPAIRSCVKWLADRDGTGSAVGVGDSLSLDSVPGPQAPMAVPAPSASKSRTWPTRALAGLWTRFTAIRFVTLPSVRCTARASAVSFCFRSRGRRNNSVCLPWRIYGDPRASTVNSLAPRHSLWTSTCP